MDPAPTILFHRLLEDRPAPASSAHAAVRSHLEHRSSWYGPCTGPLVLTDTLLAAAGRAVPVEHSASGAGLEVTVVTSGGAGGLSALAGRDVPGLRIVAAESELRDLDDLAGNAGRVAAAAGELDEVAVRVTLPDAPGWVRAVEVVEAAGLSANVRAGADAWSDRSAARRLAERLSVLVEADLAFSLTAAEGVELPRPGQAVAVVAMLVEALVDGAEPEEAAELLLLTDATRIRAGLERWNDATATRVRRRWLAVGCSPRPTVDDLVGLGLITAPQVTAPQVAVPQAP
jgi:hypothetical protein